MNLEKNYEDLWNEKIELEPEYVPDYRTESDKIIDELIEKEKVQKELKESINENRIVYTNEVIEERVNLIQEELNRIKAAMVAISNGELYESVVQDDIFFEDSDPFRSCASHLARVVEHVLKYKYSTLGPNSTVYNDWIDDFTTNQNNAIDDIEYGSDTRSKNVTNILKKLDNDIQDIYQRGIKWYKKAMKRRKDLIDGLDYIPKKYPKEWNIKRLLEDDIEELIEDLPTPPWKKD